MTKLRACRCFSMVMALALILGVGAITVPTVSAQADEGTWDIQTVDDVEVRSTSLALDSHGYPHISYTTGFTTVSTSLYYARWTGTAWETEMVDDVPAIVTSMALDSHDRPHICYTALSGQSLHYAHCTGTEWNFEEVDTGAVRDCSLALDSHDRPHISYSRITFGFPPTYPLLYTYRTDTGWQPLAETVDARDVIGISLALDSHDRPHVSYATLGVSSLHYTYRTDMGWLPPEDVDNINVGVTSLALDSQDIPHISYATLEVGLGSLHYASRAGTAWAKETVDPADNVEDCSLALDSHDRPHISYFVGIGGFFDGIGPGADLTMTGMLKYAHWTGAAWNIQTLDQETITLTLPDGVPLVAGIGIGIGSGKWSSIALDDDDLPHISYGNLVHSTAVTATSLHYARFILPEADMVPPPPAGTRVSPTVPHPLNPPQWSIQFLNISPQQASANQPVTITTNVVNTGDEAGNYNVALKINGQLEQSRMVSVGAHGTQPVKFTVTRAEPGTYDVDILGKTGSFTILGAGGTSGSKTGVLIALALIGILVVASLVVLLVRRT